MPDIIPPDSVGLVKPGQIRIQRELPLDCGSSLPEFTLSFETYGSLNPEKTNAILICHALSSDQHAAGYHSMEDRKPGWWDICIGPGKAFDTRRFFIVAANNIGGCKGSTGPNTVNPQTGRLYAASFPIVTVADWVKSQSYLADALGIERWAAVIGGSLGGMQAMQWAIDYPERLGYAIVIAAAARLSAQNIAFNEVARQAIISDPDFKGGNYYDDEQPKKGLMLARMLGHITYLSEHAMRRKFGREQRENSLSFGFDVDFQVESYLRHQGGSFVDRFDANTYLLMTKVLDYFDPAADYDGDLSRAFARTTAKFLLLSFTTDWRFAPQCSREIVKALLTAGKPVSYSEIETPDGHDAFLKPIPRYLSILNAYMKRVAAG